MEAPLLVMLACAALGIVVGLLAGMLGIGGGLIIVPALAYFLTGQLGLEFDVAVPMAVATSLSTILLTSLSSARAHYRLGNINPALITRCGIGVAMGATLGAQLASRIPGEVLKNLFATLVMLIAAYMIFGGQRRSRYSLSDAGLVVLGLITGVLSALMGIGGGAILVPALVWFSVDVRKAIGTAAVSGALIALFGTANFIFAGLDQANLPEWSLGYVYLPATLGIVSTSTLTAGWGARLGQSLNVRVLKRVFAAFLILVSLRMLLG